MRQLQNQPELFAGCTIYHLVFETNKIYNLSQTKPNQHSLQALGVAQTQHAPPGQTVECSPLIVKLCHGILFSMFFHILGRAFCKQISSFTTVLLVQSLWTSSLLRNFFGFAALCVMIINHQPLGKLYSVSWKP